MRTLRLVACSLALVFGGVAACGGGDSPPPVDSSSGSDSGANACTGVAFDSCTDNTQCMSGNCHLFSQSGFQVCTTACTPNDNTTCPTDESGANAQCNNMGICKPAQANSCTP